MWNGRGGTAEKYGRDLVSAVAECGPMCRYSIPIYGHTLRNYTDGGAKPFIEDVGTGYLEIFSFIWRIGTQHIAHASPQHGQ